MKRGQIGELEELMLLVIANLDSEAYGLNIKNYLLSHCERKISISTVHSTIHRMENKGLLNSRYDKENAPERGGRPKLIFSITAKGQKVMEEIRSMRNELWQNIPESVFKPI